MYVYGSKQIVKVQTPNLIDCFSKISLTKCRNSIKRRLRHMWRALMAVLFKSFFWRRLFKALWRIQTPTTFSYLFIHHCLSLISFIMWSEMVRKKGKVYEQSFSHEIEISDDFMQCNFHWSMSPFFFDKRVRSTPCVFKGKTNIVSHTEHQTQTLHTRSLGDQKFETDH